jgi:ubiquinol-cytochrome c reductase cytochrome c1 subunit
MRKLVTTVAFAAGIVLGAQAHAAGDAPTPPSLDWSFNGLFGTYDKASLQRGYQVYKEVCAACHSMRLVSFRHLTALGYTEDEVKAFASEYEVTDGPNDDGEMFERPARPSDRFPSPYPNDNAARVSNGGALPPDLSLIAKARVGGPDYLHALLTGYKEAPADVAMGENMYYNEYFPGQQIAMAPPLSDEIVTYADGQPNPTLDQLARDVSHFLNWAAEPELEQRKQTGWKVIIFLVIFTLLAYVTKRRIWADVH